MYRRSGAPDRRFIEKIYTMPSFRIPGRGEQPVGTKKSQTRLMACLAFWAIEPLLGDLEPATGSLSPATACQFIQHCNINVLKLTYARHKVSV